MKGQYLAVEGLLTFGMGLIIAIGTVSVFSNYQSSVLETAGERQSDIVTSEILSSFHDLEGADRAQKQIELPERIGDQNYVVFLEDSELVLSVGDAEHRTRISHFSNYELSGNSDGGKIEIVKSEGEFLIGDA